MDVFVTGMGTGLGLIVAIGAQNAFVLRQGLRREGVALVVAICAIADALLISAGTAGVGVVVERAPVLLDVLRWGGVAYLVWFAITSFRSALKPGTLAPDASPRSTRSIALTAAALTFLNPHVYLDTVLMLGSTANQFGPQRWVFALGAMLASLLWFPIIGLGAAAMSKALARPATWRVLDLLVGVVMLAVAARLALMH